MTCFNLIPAWINPEKKEKPVFYQRNDWKNIQLPCGQCIGCRVKHSQAWAVRLMHEYQFHLHTTFITLTYDNDHLPAYGSLDVRHTQLFFKKLRKKLKNIKLRYYLCGEYGEKLQRPHYHIILYGYDFPDKQYFKTVRGKKYYISEELKKIWGKGHCVIGTVDFESAAYVARYTLKKITGKDAYNHYQTFDPYTGEAVYLKPEFSTMSRRPGIAAAFYAKYKGDLYPKDYITLRGKKYKIPKFYDKRLETDDPELYDEIKYNREVEAIKYLQNITDHNIMSKEVILNKRYNTHNRNLEG